MDIALIIALVVSNIAFLCALLAVLSRVELFLREAMVYMKSNNINDVLSASSLLSRKPKAQEEEGAEVVPGQDDEEQLLVKTQKAHRRHLLALGGEEE